MPWPAGSMQRDQLLNLLDAQAREVFESAKRTALAHGGVVSALHIVAAALDISSNAASVEIARLSLLQAARAAIASRYPEPSESIVVPKETQAVISEAARLAALDGSSQAAPAHLLLASLSRTD